jgi:hypothetical protein
MATWTPTTYEDGSGASSPVWVDELGNLSWSQPAGWAPPADEASPWSPYTPSGNDQGGYVDPFGNTVYDTQSNLYGALSLDQLNGIGADFADVPGVQGFEQFVQAGWTPEAYARGLVYAGSDDPVEAGRSFNDMSRTTDILDAYMNQPALLDARGGQTFDWRNIPAIRQAYDAAGESAKAKAQQSFDVNTAGTDWAELALGAAGVWAAPLAGIAMGGAAAAPALAGMGTRALGFINPALGQIAGLANMGAGMLGLSGSVPQVGMDDLWGGDLDYSSLAYGDVDFGPFNEMTAAELSSWLDGADASDQLGSGVANEVQRWVDAGMPAIESFNWSSAPAAAVATDLTRQAPDALGATEQPVEAEQPAPAPEEQPVTTGGVTAGDLFKYAKLAYGLYQQLGGGSGGDVARRAQAVVDKQYANEQERSAAYSTYAQELLGFIPSVSEAYALDPQNVHTAFGDTFVDPNTGEVRYQLSPGTQEYYDALMQSANDTLSQALGTDVDALTEKEFNKAIEQLQGKRDKDLAAITRALYARGLLGLLSYQGSGKNLLTGETESWQLEEGQGANPYFAAYEAQIARENADLAKQSRDEADNFVQQLLNHSGGLLGQAQDIDNGMLGALFDSGEYTDEFGEVKQRRARGLYDLIAGPEGAFLSQLTGMLPAGKAAAALAGQQSAEDIRRNAILRGLFEE